VRGPISRERARLWRTSWRRCQVIAEISTLRVALWWLRGPGRALSAAWRALRGRRRLLLALGAIAGVLARLLAP
jgi:hypothetical protein